MTRLEQWGEPFPLARGVMPAAMPRGTWWEELGRCELRDAFKSYREAF